MLLGLVTPILANFIFEDSNVVDSTNEFASWICKYLINIPFQPMHDDYDLRREQMNKASLMSSKKFLENLLDMFKNHVVNDYAISACLFVCVFARQR